MPQSRNSGGILAEMPSPTGHDFSIHRRLNTYACHSGLRVHASDTVEAHDVETEFLTGPKISVAIFLEGFVELEIDGKQTRLGAGTQTCGQIWMISERMAFHHLSRTRTPVRKVIIFVPPEWLNGTLAGETPETHTLADFLNGHGATRCWTPSKRAVASAEQILNPPQKSPLLRTLSIEGKALEIVAEALSEITGATAAKAQETASCLALSRAQKIRAHVLENIDKDLSLETLARNLGISIGSMQRAFKATYDSTVVDFVRQCRLRQARKAIEQDGLSVSEAAYLAGYSNPANFSTAFKRMFGLTPSQSRQ